MTVSVLFSIVLKRKIGLRERGLLSESVNALQVGGIVHLMKKILMGTVLVEGVNMITKHTKPSMANQQGGIIHQEGPIDISNVMYVHKGKATRVGFKMDGDKKVRYAKSTGDVID